MKKLTLIACLLLAGSAIFAQKNWLSPNNKWNYHFSGGFAGISTDFELKIEKDTLVAGQQCKKMSTVNMPFFNPERFVYQEGNKIFAYNDNAAAWVKIYDFDLPVGSIVSIPLYGSYTFDYQIDSIDIVQAGNVSFRRQRVHDHASDPSQIFKMDILETIGFVGNPFDQNMPFCSFFFANEYPFCQSFVDGFDTKFICFSNDEGIFAPFGNCLFSGTQIPLQPTGIDVQITPNPASNYIQISTHADTPIRAVRITDLSGSTRSSLSELNSVSVEMNIQDLPAGLYFVVIQTNAGEITQRIIKMQ